MRALSFATAYTPPVPENVVPMPPELRVGSRAEFRAKVQAVLDAGIVDVVIDCSGTGYVDSAGTGVLVSLSRKARELGGSVTLRGVNEAVRERFALTKDRHGADDRGGPMRDARIPCPACQRVEEEP
jgi:anti-sigma B factor antagonist